MRPKQEARSVEREPRVNKWITAIRQTLLRRARQNRRREHRISFKAPIEIRTPSGVTYGGFSRDLSPLGMGALITCYLEIGDEVWVKYEHPAAGEQFARVTVRRATVKQRHGYRYGFEFLVPMDVASAG